MSPQYFESKIKVGIVKNFPVRSTLLPHKSGAILISPIKFDALQVQQLTKFNVTDIIAPSDIHHLFILDAHKLFPKAKLWKVVGLERKRSDVRWDATLGVDHWPYDEIRFLKIEGAEKLNEHLFLHTPSKTLVVTDLLFNIRNSEGFGAKIFFNLGGTYNRTAVSRLWKFMIKDKPSFQESMKQLLLWDFERIAVAHGENINANGKSVLKKALQDRGLTV